jgi:hypothetical protein
METLKNIVDNILKEGGKLFGVKASRVTSEEMRIIFNELHGKLNQLFSKIQLTKSLKSKETHGDIDIVILNHNRLDVMKTLRDTLGNSVKEYSKNGNISSILYKPDNLDKSVHVDFLSASTEEDFDPQYEYLSYSDFSGILGVLSRRVKFNYGTQGVYKIYEDKRGQYHYILLTKNLKDGLRILGYNDILSSYDKIENLDDVVDFISASPFFDSDFYSGMNMNHSDRKRTRIGRPTADYIRKALISLNKHRFVMDDDYYLKSLFPDLYKKLQLEIEKIENTVVPKSKYNGEWLMKNFPNIKPGPIVGKVLKFWFDTYKDSLDTVDEDELKRSTADFLNKT